MNLKPEIVLYYLKSNEVTGRGMMVRMLAMAMGIPVYLSPFRNYFGGNIQYRLVIILIPLLYAMKNLK